MQMWAEGSESGIVKKELINCMPIAEGAEETENRSIVRTNRQPQQDHRVHVISVTVGGRVRYKMGTTRKKLNAARKRSIYEITRSESSLTGTKCRERIRNASKSWGDMKQGTRMRIFK